ncbi:MAG: ubiquinol-cytochrome C chaperone family protein [Rhodospirillales bacterium]
MSLIDQIKGWFETPFDNPTALSLYRSIVAQSRLPIFYDSYGVADTPDGRYDLVALHAFLVMRRLKSGGEDAIVLSQALHDLMFADMDQNLREMGIGDHGMPKRMKKLAEGFRGRIMSYDMGLDATEPQEIESALRRNLYRKTEPSDATVGKMARYMRLQDAHLAEIETSRLLAGDMTFMAPGAPGKGDTGKKGAA